jgi:hypothetical protein
VGIGTTSPVGKFTAQNTDNSTVAVFCGESGGTARGLRIATGIQAGVTSNNELAILDAQSNAGVPTMVFQTAGTERARIDSSGNFTVGAAAAATNRSININGVANKAGRIDFQESGASKWLVGNGAASENGVFEVYSNTTGNGVQLGRSATSWSAGSDERMKDIIEPITNATNKVSTLRAVIGKYKTDEVGTRRSFLIAQDLQKVLPEAVDDINPEKLAVRYTEVIPLLVAAIKEQQVIITQLQADVAALKGTA